MKKVIFTECSLTELYILHTDHHNHQEASPAPSVFPTDAHSVIVCVDVLLCVCLGLCMVERERLMVFMFSVETVITVYM